MWREFDLPRNASASRLARELIDTELGGGLESDVALLTSEIVTTAIIHGRPPVALRIGVGEASVRVEVLDSSNNRPVMRPCNTMDLEGHDLRFVDGIPSQWGIDYRSTGKSVWFELTGF